MRPRVSLVLFLVRAASAAAARVPWARALSREEVAALTPDKVLGGRVAWSPR